MTVRSTTGPIEIATSAGPIDARPSFDDVFLAFALKLSERSTCRRLRVGCFITSVDHREVYGFGYNGNATSLHNGCDSDTPGACGCLHAEENACLNSTASPRDPKIVYCTHQPCVACAKRLINLGGVVRVMYVHAYRSAASAEVFAQAGIPLHQVAVNP